MRIMTFNLWVGGKSDERRERVIQMIKKYTPDTIGFQEADAYWMDALKNALCDTYGFAGDGRDGNSNSEHNPIFYKKSVFDLIDSGTRWLSHTPNVVSKHPDSSLNRIYTFVTLKRKSDGTELTHVNTHFDHIGEQARISQAEILAKFVSPISDRPLIVTGDMNTGFGSVPYETIENAGLTDAYKQVKDAIQSYTFTNYGRDSMIIDFVFTSDSLPCTVYKVCNEKINGDFPSDHHPVYVEADI